mgnify:CR=1 FL=1
MLTDSGEALLELEDHDDVCGDVELTATDLVLTIRSVARNPRSTGCFLAVKAVHLRPAATTATTSSPIKNQTATQP